MKKLLSILLSALICFSSLTGLTVFAEETGNSSEPESYPTTTEQITTSTTQKSTIPGGAYVTYNLTNVISSNMQEEVWGYYETTFSPVQGYKINYISVKQGDEDMNVIDNGDGTYTFKNEGGFTDNLTITAGAQLDTTGETSQEYSTTTDSDIQPTTTTTTQKSTIPGGAYVTYNLTNVTSSNMQEEVWGYYETTLSPVQGYKINYISVKQGDKDMDVIDNGDGTYTFKNEGGFTDNLTITATAEPDATPSKPTSTIPDKTYVKVNYLYACDGDELSFSYKPNYCKYGSSFTTTVKGKETLAYDIISDIGVVMGKDTFIDPIEVDKYTYTIDIPCVTGDITIGALTNSSAHTVHGIGSLCSFTTNLEHVSLYQYIPGDGTTPSYSYPIESQIVNYDYSFYFQIIPDYGYEIVSVTPKRRYLNYDTGEYKISEYSVEKADKNEYLVKAWGEQVLLEGEVRKIQSPAEISESKLTLKAGDTKTLKVTDGTAKAWATSNKNVATVNNGKVTAVGKGTATITATLTTGEKLTCKVTVVNSPKLTSSNVILKSGATKTVKAVGGTVKSWTTSNKNVATVKDGKITALNKGTATVTATLTTGKKLTCKVTVATAPRLTKTTVKVKKGGTATVLISGKVATIDNKYTNTKVAKINSKVSTSVLKIKGLKKGTTTLKIKVNGVKNLNLKVNVK